MRARREAEVCLLSASVSRRAGLFEGVVAGANERSGENGFEPHLFSGAPVVLKLVWVHEADNRKMFPCRLKILSEREKVRATVPKVAEGS